MCRFVVISTLAFACVAPLSGQDGKRPTAARRGERAIRGDPAMNPSLWSASAFDNLWKRWDLKEKPADYAKAVEERYGLYPASYANNGLPMGLHVSRSLLGKGIINDCLLCHAGTIAGQRVIGMGNASLDLQSLFDDLTAVDRMPYPVPVPVSAGRGVIDPVNPVAYLMGFRDADLKVHNPEKLEYTPTVSSDPPAWWLLKHKKIRNWTGGVDVNATRIDMVNLLTPFNSPEHIKSHEKTFEDIHAFVMSVEAPKYPFPIDRSLAATGEKLFVETCAKCHGAYGANRSYPNKVVALETLGTDPALAKSLLKKNMDIFNVSWFAQQQAPDGSFYTVNDTPGYQAPPLDGVWATAPYFHNSTVPTLYHVLNSKARPGIFTRSYRTGKEDYDSERVGWKITVLASAPAKDLPAHERRKICDTTQHGRSNAGHTFGDRFTEVERQAVVEYLKTL